MPFTLRLKSSTRTSAGRQKTCIRIVDALILAYPNIFDIYVEPNLDYWYCQYGYIVAYGQLFTHTFGSMLVLL